MTYCRVALISFLLLWLSLLGAEKIVLRKDINPQPPKTHPYTNLLSEQTTFDRKTIKPQNYDKLLVILVDFQEETPDDPLTTGNGKFLLESDPDYLYSIGSPPHDREYFQMNMEAIRYYYQAVSNGSYNLQYDVFPTTGAAFSLPHSMGYYNPPQADSELFLSRMEEYFRECFEIADQQEPDIDFSAYGHYMIIHAGSDWQHDVNGDTPSDIPSFFIRVGEGKEAVVDGGSTLISHACNVPGTISQDFSTSSGSNGTFHGGYGALNSVLVHEFGHSLGLVDLYNVRTFQPMVGMFDIMDSGGSGVLVDQLQDGSYVMVEGIIPALPGAFSRALLFEDYYRSNGYMKDVTQLDMDTTINLAASSMKQTGTIRPHIIKIPLSEKEYLLVENRSVDPDGDGGTAVFSSLDGRVILYPTPIYDPANNPSYEYDYLLPSFQTGSGAAIGGGVLVWHVNEEVLFEQGTTQSNGTWVSNFDNNSVNTQFSNRGVKVVEADGLQDIGNNWSWFWTGTQYEYFHKYKPNLDANGFFINWSQNLWKPELSSTTVPAVLDGNGVGSQYKLYGIGNPGAVMQLMVKDNFFSSLQIVNTQQTDPILAPVINTSFAEACIPVIDNDSITLLSWDGSAWTDQMGPFPFEGSGPAADIVVANQQPDNYKELVLTGHDKISLIDFADDLLNQVGISLPEEITTIPLPIANALFVATEQHVLRIQGNTISHASSIPNVKQLGSFANLLLAITANQLYLLYPHTLGEYYHCTLPETFGAYRPVAFSGGGRDIAYLMADSGNVYSFEDETLTKIFTNPAKTHPTQMGIAAFGGESPVLFFGNGSRLHSLSMDGSNLQGYPYNAWPLSFTPYCDVYAMYLDEDLLFLPYTGKGYIAFAYGNGPQWDKSLLGYNAKEQTKLYWNQYANRLEWQRLRESGTLAISSISLAQNPIRWNGFRNGVNGTYSGSILHAPAQTAAFDAYVYPNPVRGNEFRLRIENSTDEISVDIFDISGSKISATRYPYNQQSIRDIRLSVNLASGVYIVSVKSGGDRKTVKFAVEK